MKKEEYRRISTLFIRARGVDGARRAQLLEQARKGHPEVVERVVALLNAEGVEPDFMEVPYLGEKFTISGMADTLDKEPVLPKKIDRYTIDGLIGMGGMGIVYRGRQPSPRREVAVKVMRPGVVSADKLQRFLFEVEMLGKLDHPGIAKIFEAGSHESELGPVPFFAMEWVEGRTLLDHARESELSRADEVELMILLCEAVQHAHERGIVHRDLKPANIVVTGEGRPKILDFGVARPTEYDAHGGSRLTQTGQLIGTLAYMSPEQLIGDGSHVDTRSDVYSLGAVAYELLTGRPPFDLEGKSLPEAARFLAERTPLPAGSVRTTLKGDLETILHKALEKDRDRRYASANELATDLRHYLNSEAILARPPSTLYQLRMFARRRKALVASGLAAILALIIGLGTTLWSLVEVRAANAETQHEAEQLNAVRSFLVNVFQSVGEGREGRDVTLLEILEGMPDALAERFGDQPETHLDLLLTVGQTFNSLGKPQRAELELRKAEKLASLLPDDHDLALQTKLDLGSTLIKLDRRTEAEVLLRAALEAARTSRDRAGKASYAVIALNLLGSLLNATDPVQAERILRQSVAESEALGDGREFKNLHLHALGGLAGVLVSLGQNVEARVVYEDALRQRLLNSGPEDEHTLYIIEDYAMMLNDEGEHARARELLVPVVNAYEESLGRESTFTLGALNYLAVATLDDGELGEAMDLFEQVALGRQKVLGADHPETLITRSNLAVCYMRARDFDRAEDVLCEVIDQIDENVEPGHRDRIAPRLHLAKLYIDTQRYAEAELLLQESLELLETHFDQTHWQVKNVKCGLVMLYDAWGKPDLANLYR